MLKCALLGFLKYESKIGYELKQTMDMSTGKINIKNYFTIQALMPILLPFCIGSSINKPLCDRLIFRLHPDRDSADKLSDIVSRTD